jgi:hypothetical protein
MPGHSSDGEEFRVIYSTSQADRVRVLQGDDNETHFSPEDEEITDSEELTTSHNYEQGKMNPVMY